MAAPVQPSMFESLGQIIPTILLIIVFNFVLIRIAPGNPAEIMAGDFATPEVVETIRVKYGLDQPVHVQLVQYLGSVLTGDLGFSYDYGRPVLDGAGRQS